MSPIELLLPISSVDCLETVSISITSPSPLPIDAPFISLSKDEGQTEIILNSSGAGRFSLCNGDTIIIQPDIPAPGASFYPFFLTGSVLSLLLYQRGNLVLHGSVVGIDGQAVAFLGHSGAGKSSMAAACVEQGMALLADDAVVVDSRGGEMLTVPGFPRLKVHQQTIDALQVPENQLQDFFHGESEEYGIRVDENFLDKKLPLAALYLLGESEKQESIEPLTQSAAFVELLAHVIPARYGVNGGVRMFKQMSNVLKKVPVFRLLRQKDPRRLHLHPEMIVEHLSGFSAS